MFSKNFSFLLYINYLILYYNIHIYNNTHNIAVTKGIVKREIEKEIAKEITRVRKANIVANSEYVFIY